MGDAYKSYTRLDGGIADYSKDSRVPNTVAWMRSVDYRSDPRIATILPKTSKESGTIIEGLVKWGAQVDTDAYLYDDVGNLYKRTATPSYSLLRSVANSNGNGLAYYSEDDFLYYTSDKLIGRYGRLDGSPSFADDFLGSEGGVPLNTHSIDLESSSSQYLSRADTASLSITGDLTLEAYIKPESLPSVGNQMDVIAKWDESGALRSYRFGIYAISGFFGDGSDGALTISTNTTEAPIDASCSGTSGTFSLSATNASFAAGQIILIHQTRGTSAGTSQRTKIASYTAGTITTEDALNHSYSSSGANAAQVVVMEQYTNVTVNSGITWTAKAWDGSVGGILAFLANGTVTVTGNITASEKGFLGGTVPGDSTGHSGEGTSGARDSTNTSYGNAGGGIDPGINAAGGGGGNGTSGSVGQGSGGVSAGSTAGTADLTTMVFGGGGASTLKGSINPGATGGQGGGIIFITGTTISITGSISNAGQDGGDSTSGDFSAAGGGGAGGSTLLKCQTATLGTNLITAAAGSGGTATGGTSGNLDGGAGGVGRIHIDYYTSYTGTTTPTIDATQDNTLVTTTTYQLSLSVSDDGTNPENLRRGANISTDMWSHIAVAWDASASQAEFFLDGVSLGTATGSMTAIDDNASEFHVGASENSGGSKANLFDGKVDDVRVWSTLRTESELFSNKDVEIPGSSSNLVAYYQFDNADTDETANSNDLNDSGSPTYSTDVPFSSPTSRLDLDQESEVVGNTTALATSIAETSSDKKEFVPAKDPQKSVEVNISAKGTGDWTLTVHDPLNREVASVTVANADLPSSGDYEFVFASVWRPILGVTYHFHVTSTVANGTVVSSGANDLSTADFHTYYQFLVEDTQFHPIIQFLNFLAFGNDRYVATYDGSTYNPHRLTLPGGWKVRCYAWYKHYLAIGCWKGTNVYDYDDGIIFFWDGISDTYNFYVAVPEGAINAMLFSRGELHVWAGYQGDHLVYLGGDKATKIKRVPKIADDKYIEIYPGAVSMWRSLIRYGVGVSDSAIVERGVYTHGSLNERYPNSLSYDYPISTGNRLNTVSIGMVLPVGQKLLISWKDNVSYGVDVVDPAGDPFATATIEYMIEDDDMIYKERLAQVLRAEFEPLNSGESVAIKHKFDRADSFTELASEATAAATELRENVNDSDRHREYQIAVDLATSTTTSPKLTGVTFGEDMLEDESYV